MPLTLDHRRVGDVYVVTCVGRIVEGAESLALQQRLDSLLPFGPVIILHIGGVDFVDSSGLGLLVRYAARMRNMHGRLALCEPSPKMRTLLTVTRLWDVFDIHESEEAAIGESHKRFAPASASAAPGPEILCVARSLDVQAYVRELLAHAGFRVLTAGNVPDAAVLMQARRPPIVIVGDGLRQARTTSAGEKFNRLADQASVVELPPDFSNRDAAGAAAALLEQIRSLAASS